MEGHTGATTEYPNGIYHYHCSNVNYMDSGFYVLKRKLWHKRHIHFFKIVILMVIAVLTTNCNKKRRRRRFAFVFTQLQLLQSKDTILITNANLKLNNGIYFFNSKPYSGYIKENAYPRPS
jgi:hypothetical protein